jgi:hypothetical protein
MRILRWIFYLALTAAVAYGGYLVYMKWVQGQPISSLWQKAQEYASTTAGTVSSVTKTVGVVQSGVASTTNAITSVKTSIGDVLTGLGNAIQNAGMLLAGTTTAVEPSAAPATSATPAAPAAASSQPATITTAVGVPLYFSMTSGTLYSVSWGDGTTSSGNLNQGVAIVVRHSWTAVGNYTVQVTIDASSYTFPIRVYNQ